MKSINALARITVLIGLFNFAITATQAQVALTGASGTLVAQKTARVKSARDTAQVTQLTANSRLAIYPVA